MNFKIGDKIECMIERHPILSRGQVVVITDIHEEGRPRCSDPLYLFGDINFGLRQSDAKLVGMSAKPKQYIKRHEF